MESTRTDRSRRLRVVESFRTPRATTNPYLVLLLRSLPADLDVRTFSWRTALLGRYDVLHVHWPEVVVDRRNPVRAAGAALLLALVLLRCRLTRTAVVRTAHNVTPHEAKSATTRWALRLCDASAGAWIRLNETTPTPSGVPVTTIALGHYREWFHVDPSTTAPVRGRLTYVGLVRRYKGVEALVDAFVGTRDAPGAADLSLHVVGRPHDAALDTAVRTAAAPDPRITLRLEHVPDEELVREVLEAELVVLPYRDLHNSSAAVMALSLDRPVLVTDNAVTRALAAEVGEDFVLRYDGALDASTLTDALARRRTAPPGRPDLSAREWSVLGEQHAAVFREAAAAARARTTRPTAAVR